MAHKIPDVIPDAEVLLDLQPEELAGAALQVLNSRLDANAREEKFHPWNFANELDQLH